MICPYCKGTGKSNMWINGGCVPCTACKGTGNMEVTNEEWLRFCSTEELAEFIRKQRDDWSDGWYSDWHPFSEIIEWLKQPHGGES